MALVASLISPTDGAEDVVASTEIVVGAIENAGGSVTNIQVEVDAGQGLFTVFNGLDDSGFLLGLTGELIDNNPGSDDDFTLVVIQSVSFPEFAVDQLVTVVVTLT